MNEVATSCKIMQIENEGKEKESHEVMMPTMKNSRETLKAPN